MDPVVVGVFTAVSLGMMLGELPGLKLDRTGIALLGAITPRLGVTIDWRGHARVGVPVTALSLAFAAGWLAVREWSG